MTLNIQNLDIQLTRASASIGSPADTLLAAKAAEKLRQGTVTVVANTAALPAITDVNEGALYFVQADQATYVADAARCGWRSMAVDTTGLVWGWGSNTCGILGDGTVVPKSSPVSVVGGFTDWCQVSAGSVHTAAVRQNGTLWTWGAGVQLGTGTLTPTSSPVSVVGGFTDWCQVSAGSQHTLAVRQNGTLWTWGYGSCGRLGDGSIANKSSPVSAVGGFTDWCQVSAGAYHSAAVRQNGTLWAWGRANYGQVGDDSTVNKSSPVSVVGNFTDWCQVSAGSFHTAAIRQNGSLWSWGFGDRGRLGDGTTVSKSSPVSVVGGFTDWCQVSAGSEHAAAVRRNGTLWAWGCNGSGRLGDGTIINKSSPVSVVGGFTDWCQVSAGMPVGSRHTAAIRQNSTLWAWGCNSLGGLGDGTTTSTPSPVSIIGGFTDWCQIHAGNNRTMAIRSTLKRTI